MTPLLIWAALALADEQLTFTARWMGVEAGQATATTHIHDGIREVTVTARNASWLDGLYPIDDRMVSEARLSGGSMRYRTSFREGRFLQDQDMQFGTAVAHVDRTQFVDGQWRASTADVSNGGVANAEDPISAFYAIREANLAVGAQLRLQVFNGKRLVPVVATCVRREELRGRGPVRLVTVRASREGEFEGGIDLYLSDANVPTLAVLPTRAGPVRVEVE